MVLIAAYYLPFATINYGMHSTKHLFLDIQLYGVCGRQSRKTLQQISLYMETLRNAVNRPEKLGGDDRLQQIMDTKPTRINAFICGDEGVAHADRQYSTWVAAGLIVTVILMPAGVLSLLGIAICALAIARRHDRCGFS